MNLQKVEFVKSAVKPSAFIESSMPEIVFAGKSNVGKSSVINRVLNRKNFARVGSAPGKTIHVNYFLVDQAVYFVDLPGYGYAQVAKAERDRWGKLMEQYFAVPDRITLGILIVDARHKPTADDITMATWFMQTGCPLVVLANKVDKVKSSELDGNLTVIRTTLQLPEETVLLPFSAEKGTNRELLISLIEKAI